MIIKIDHTKIEIAYEIRNIFQVSYSVEAKLLRAIDFPPLKRTIPEFIDSCSIFYAYYFNEKVVGVIEIKSNKHSTHIQSLVVHPEYFRKGIGKQLVNFIIEKYNSKLFTVETGRDNFPAIKLYKQLGFIEEDQWDTEHGVVKISFKKIN